MGKKEKKGKEKKEKKEKKKKQKKEKREKNKVEPEEASTALQDDVTVTKRDSSDSDSSEDEFIASKRYGSEMECCLLIVAFT